MHPNRGAGPAINKDTHPLPTDGLLASSDRFEARVNDSLRKSASARMRARFAAIPGDRSRGMQIDNDWWSWILIAALFGLTGPGTYLPLAKILGYF